MITFHLTDAQAADAREHGILVVEAIKRCPTCDLTTRHAHELGRHLCPGNGGRQVWLDDAPLVSPVEPGAQITVTTPCPECGGSRERGRNQYGEPMPPRLGEWACVKDDRAVCRSGHVPAFTATVTEVLPIATGDDLDGQHRIILANGEAWLTAKVHGPPTRVADLSVWPDVTPGQHNGLVLTDIETA